MSLEKLKIVFERRGSRLQFDDSRGLVALFNPDKLVFSKSANWKKKSASQRDVPELQFTNAEPRTLRIDLVFDTYDTSKAKKDDVRTYTDELHHLTTVERHGDKHRPPVCRLRWGSVGVFFQGVLVSLEQQFILFTEDGTPVRAKSGCTFKEWRTNYEDINRQDTHSTDVAKAHIVKRGESLSSIAAEEYEDPRLWRPIAEENGLDDPLVLVPGTVLLIPTLSR